MANTDRARKLLVRTSLVTSTTIATIVGAQNLAMMDTRQLLVPETIPTQTEVVVSQPTTAAVVEIAATAETTIIHAAPSITILRQSEQATSVTQSNIEATAIPNKVIQPPTASQITAPQATILQQPLPQRSHSSR